MFHIKRVLLGCSVLLCFFGVTFGITDPAIKYPDINLYLKSASLDRETPTRFKPKHLRLAPTDIAYWKKILPYEQDKYADIYMVIPQLGLIAPIQQIPRDSADRNSMTNGRDIQINRYLQGGIIEYAGSVAPGHEGKRIDFGHSNYFKNDPGRYKTIFANLMWLDPGDEVWYFVRNGDLYTLHRYQVTASYPTRPSNTGILKRDGQGADAIIFGCYHGIDGRWIIEATYLGTPVPAPAQGGEDPYAALSPVLKSRLERSLQRLERIPLKRRKQHITYIYSRIQRVRDVRNLSAEQELMLSYLVQQFGRLYQ